MNSKSLKKKMSSALMRSGYLMESRIITNLAKAGFFIEPNQRIGDSRTGKSREIDLIAELWDYKRDERIRQNSSVSVRFVCEAKNNPNPVVLLTRLPFSPNIEMWESLREVRTGLFKNHHTDISFQDFLVDDSNIYTQYCSFKPKGNGEKAEWMASHPDDFHDDLEKLISYCDEQVELLNGLDDKYNRLHLYLPVVILGGELYISEPGVRSISLKKVNIGHYIHFGINKDGQQTLAFVVFVTEKSLLKFFEETTEMGCQIEMMFNDSSGKK